MFDIICYKNIINKSYLKKYKLKNKYLIFRITSTKEYEEK